MFEEAYSNDKISEVEPTPKHWSFYNRSLDIPSVRGEKPCNDASGQTEPIFVMEKETQIDAPVSIEIQTDEVKKAAQNEYPPSLCKFIQRVTPMLCAELKDNVYQANIFTEFVKIMPEVRVVSEARKLISVRNKSAALKRLSLVRTSWSHSGSFMAISYVIPNHEAEWCHHTSIIALYNFNKLDNSTFYPAPEREWADVDHCITSVQFNPIFGTLLAIGNIKGEIGLVDFMPIEGLRDTQADLIWKTNCHSCAIVAIRWFALTENQTQEHRWQNRNPASQFFVSASTDGYIGLWSFGRVSFSLCLEKKFALNIESIPKTLLPLTNVAYREIEELGITHLSISEADSTKLVFSTYGEMIFYGDIFSNNEISPGSTSFEGEQLELPLFDPDCSFLFSTTGQIVGLQSSPFHQSYFLVLTREGCITLHNVSKPGKSTLEFHLEENWECFASDIKWSLQRPTVFAVARGQDVFFFDLLKSKNTYAQTLKHKYYVRSIDFSKSRPGEIVVCDTRGEVAAWELPTDLTRRKQKELAKLIDLEEEMGNS